MKIYETDALNIHFFSVHTSIIWLKHLIQTQSSQLMAIGNVELFTTFGPLLGIAEHRANTFQQLTKLDKINIFFFSID